MKTRCWELDAIRVISCFLVIFIHVNSHEIIQKGFEGGITVCFFMCIARCSVPMFFMLSGIVFMEKEVSITKIYCKYIYRLLLALLCWSTFYAVLDCIMAQQNGIEVSFRYLVLRILSGHYHMWFLPCMIGVYMFLPVLQKLVRDCPISLVIYVGSVLLIAVIEKVTLDPVLRLQYNTAIWDNIWNKMEISELSLGILYFILGYYLYLYQRLFSAIWCGILYFLSIILMFIVNFWFGAKIEPYVDIRYTYLNIYVLISSATFFVLALHYFSREGWGEKIKQFVKNVSKCTFGIYLIHPFFIEHIQKNKEFLPSLFSILSISVFVFLISYLVIWVIRKIPIVGSYIV